MSDHTFAPNGGYCLSIRDSSPLFALFAIRYSGLFAVRYSRLFAIRYLGFPDTKLSQLKNASKCRKGVSLFAVKVIVSRK